MKSTCRFWLCRIVGHDPIPTVVEFKPGTIFVGGNSPRRWTCSRSLVEIGYRE